jgi:hypothetical protein
MSNRRSYLQCATASISKVVKVIINMCKTLKLTPYIIRYFKKQQAQYQVKNTTAEDIHLNPV